MNPITSSPIDLHIHSSFSDGSDTLPDLLQNLIDRKIHTFSLTDHDTLEGCIRMKEMVPEGIRFIPGIEFSCITPVKKCHILGYGYDEKNPELLSAIKKGQNLRKEKLDGRINYLREVQGIDFSEHELHYLYSLGSAGKPHIARLLVNKGLAADISDAIKRYINGYKGGTDRIDAAIAIEGILAAGGVPVWAHPLGGEGEKRLSEDEFCRQLEYLISIGIKGLECYYSRYTREEVAFLVGKANENHLLISGGSDYHGKNKNIPLGILGADEPEVTADKLSLLAKLMSLKLINS